MHSWFFSVDLTLQDGGYTLHKSLWWLTKCEAELPAKTAARWRLILLVARRKPHLSSLQLHDCSPWSSSPCFPPCCCSSFFTPLHSADPLSRSVHHSSLSTCLWKVNWSSLGLWVVSQLIVCDTHTHNGPFTLSRAEDKQLWMGWETRWGC